MGRLPLARKKVLDAATGIVMAQGAAALTYEELVEKSGISRGGITYHFPTKNDLLTALVEQDLEQWRSSEAVLRPAGCAPETAELIAYLRLNTERGDDRRRLVAGMLSAVTHDPPILDPIRTYEQNRIAGIDWTDQALRLQMLRFAAAGMFWLELFGCATLPDAVRARFVTLLEELARDWSSDAASDFAADTGDC